MGGEGQGVEGSGVEWRGKRGGCHCKTFSFRAMEVSYWVSQESKEMLGVGLRMELGSK